MATYDIASHRLEFQDDYKKILVYGSGSTPIAEYNLQASGQSVSVAVEDDDYVIGYADDYTLPTCKVDVGAGTTLAFDATRMGGIGIVDLRDMKSGGPYTISFSLDLECSAVKLKYVSGPFALHLLIADPNCFSSEEV